MKKYRFTAIIVIFIIFIFLFQLKSINHPIKDNDEGIYLTTFLLVNKGFPAYQKTFLSQPPGFLITIYPGFILFGKTLPVARQIVGCWSLVGLLAIIWLFYELKTLWVGIFAISLLSLIPTYINQTTTFQSDILVSVFSLLSLASLIRFKRLQKINWLILSSFFLNLAFWTKFDISIIPSLLVILYLSFSSKQLSISRLLFLLVIFLTVSLLFLMVAIVPFGISEVFNNSIRLRFQALPASSTSISLIIGYLNKDPLLQFIIVLSLLIALFKKNSIKYPSIILLIWILTISFLMLLYRPVFEHHLAIIAVPYCLFFSLSIYSFFQNYFSLKTIKKLFIIFCIFVIIYRINLVTKNSSNILNYQQQAAIEIIQKNTNISDLVISDEGILTGISGRLPPPALADISFVRIYSNNLSPESYAKIVNNYQPKMIIAWNGRLESIKSFSQTIKKYRLLKSFGKSRKIYIR